MGPRVTKSELQIRLGSHLPMHYVAIVTIFKGIALYNATLVAVALLGTDYSELTAWKASSAAFWLASFVAIILTYDAMFVGTLNGLANERCRYRAAIHNRRG